ncbi:hypothetical protein [Fuerstiella marisgermanici]|uniref:Uncharacterized protein n=1 Tax=Fuerstiella marisgermanici TaxID=1891926 RepID=A0A1P8WMZ4_9PLAN|nr:hypothetical protein [Fuerstiella marisgermanici]APZ95420.1 hypothetical protein Fuma_05078 [Fuerstiella marisgermanici]
MLAKVDTNNSEINPYAPPATNDTAKAADAKVRLSADDRYRVVGKNLVCRVGCEQFPNVCWLTGSTSELVGEYSRKVRYLSDTARGWLIGLATCVFVASQLAIEWLDVHHPVFMIGIVAFIVLGGGIYTHYFENTLTIIVGESAVARKKRRLARVTPFCVAGLGLLAIASVVTVDVVNSMLVMWSVPVVCVLLIVGYLWLSPKNFNVQVNQYDEDSVIISGLTKGFLETIRNKNRSWLPID